VVGKFVFVRIFETKTATVVVILSKECRFVIVDIGGGSKTDGQFLKTNSKYFVRRASAGLVHDPCDARRRTPLVEVVILKYRDGACA
jgi:hypothetical protein